MIEPRRAILLALAVSVAVGCKGGGGASVPLDTACADLAASRCKMQQSCDPRGFEFVWADLATCTARTQLTCPIVAAAPGSGYTGDNVEACARAMSATSCEDFMNNIGPAACRIRGTLPLGAGCIDDAQCAGAGNYCLLGGPCGWCTARNPISDFGTCGDNAGCLDGLICSLSMCAVPLPPGSACDLTHPCAWPYTCISGVCALPTLGEGALCNVNEKACDWNQRLICYEADVDVCTVWPAGHLGEACGLMGNIVGTCLDGLICDIPPAQDLGTCQPPLPVGASCTDTDYFFDRCQPPATCTTNVCRLPDPATCASTDAGTD